MPQVCCLWNQPKGTLTMRKAVIALLGLCVSLALILGVTMATASSTKSNPGVVTTVAPTRILDTRSNLGAAGPIPSLGIISLQVTGQAGVPANATSVDLNITVVSPQSGGYITSWQSGVGAPNASTLNFSPGQTVANAAKVLLGTDGKIQFLNGSGGTIQLIADVTGYTTDAPAPGSGPAGPAGPAGAVGPAGPQGPAGPAGPAVTTTVTATPT